MMAVRNGLWATFSPKPLPEEAGNGFRIAMRPTRGGEPCADAFLAGILEHFLEMQVFFDPREESYERLGTFGAPDCLSWADTGRASLLRRKADGRIELSAADGAANPYLCFALLLYAGADGVERGLSLRPAGGGAPGPLPEPGPGPVPGEPVPAGAAAPGDPPCVRRGLRGGRALLALGGEKYRPQWSAC